MLEPMKTELTAQSGSRANEGEGGDEEHQPGVTQRSSLSNNCTTALLVNVVMRNARPTASRHRPPPGAHTSVRAREHFPLRYLTHPHLLVTVTRPLPLAIPPTLARGGRRAWGRLLENGLIKGVRDPDALFNKDRVTEIDAKVTMYIRSWGAWVPTPVVPSPKLQGAWTAALVGVSPRHGCNLSRSMV
ncbi:hypothetical protein HD554DRAFT_2038286 [Boletus coccyginus]|nr:hypothetical protein HD554DRAFT_2038286 [Boletus coccyginus]